MILQVPCNRKSAWKKGSKVVGVNLDKRHLPKCLKLLQNSYNLLEGDNIILSMNVIDCSWKK